MEHLESFVWNADIPDPRPSLEYMKVAHSIFHLALLNSDLLLTLDIRGKGREPGRNWEGKGTVKAGRFPSRQSGGGNLGEESWSSIVAEGLVLHIRFRA